MNEEQQPNERPFGFIHHQGPFDHDENHHIAEGQSLHLIVDDETIVAQRRRQKDQLRQYHHLPPPAPRQPHGLRRPYADAANAFAEAACASICAVSVVLKKEAEHVKYRVQRIQDQQQQISSSAVTVTSTANTTTHETTTTSSMTEPKKRSAEEQDEDDRYHTNDEERRPRQSCKRMRQHLTTHESQQNDDAVSMEATAATHTFSNSDRQHTFSTAASDNVNSVASSLEEEKQSIRQQTYRMKRLSILLRRMDHLNIQLLNELRQCAVAAATTSHQEDQQQQYRQQQGHR